MKKSIIFALLSVLLLSTLSLNVTAEDKSIADPVYKYPFVESTVSYKQVVVYKVLDQKEAYIVMYSKGHREVGNVVIPKKWYKERPAKLRFRALQPGMDPYMTVFYREGNFSHVVLTMPTSRSASVWGVADSNVTVDANKDTFDIVY